LTDNPTLSLQVWHWVAEQGGEVVAFLMCLVQRRATGTRWRDLLARELNGVDDHTSADAALGLADDVCASVRVSEEHYLGTLVVRHQLTPELAEAGGHVGYHVVAPWQRHGHATRMLAAGLAECRRIGLKQVLLTCNPNNEASRRVILANGGTRDGQAAGEDRFLISLLG